MWKRIVTVLMVGFVLGGVVFGQEEEESDEMALLKKIVEDVRARGPADEKEYFRMLVDAVKAEFGPEHSFTLAVMTTVSHGLYKSGAYAESQEMFEEVLAIRRRELGASHPDTLKSMANLAVTLKAQGDFQGAREMEEEVLALCRRDLGASHPDTLAAMNNLASTLSAQGDFQGARERFEQALAIRRQDLGSTHPDTLTSMGNLANTLYAQGDFRGARELLETALEIGRRALGAEHPDTLTLMANFAIVLSAQGDFQDAREIEEKVLGVLRREFGEEHPDTLMSKANLASTLYAQGDFQASRKILEEVLATKRRVIGAEHPDTLISMDSLAVTLASQGDLQSARAMQEEVLAIRRRTLGPAHPETLTSMANLAGTLKAQGDLKAAREIEEQVLEARRREFGTEHPDTLKSMVNLSNTLYAQGNFQDARNIQEEVLATLRRTLGIEHPDTLSSMANLAGILYEQKDFSRAREIQEKVLLVRRQTLGPEHPDTLTAMHNLAMILRNLGELDGAHLLLEDILQIRRKKFGADQTLGIEVEYKNLAALGDIYRDLKKPDQAVQRYLQALDALEVQTRTIATAEDARSRFKQKYEVTYYETLKILIALGRKEEAHDVVERFRAQGFLSLLAEGGVVLAEMPTDLGERRRALDVQYDAIILARDNLDPNRQKDAFEALLKEQQQLRRERERLNAELLTRVPEVAEVEIPEPLTVNEIRSVLEPGTLMLSYKVGPEKTYLFSLSRASEIVVHEINVDEDTLRNQVSRFFGQLRESATAKVSMTSWLYDTLLGSASEQIAECERLLILPDGPLFYLPFGSLVRHDGSYLIESKAVHSVVSATVYGHLLRRRPDGDEYPAQLAAFGDPVYKNESVVEKATVREGVERGVSTADLRPLSSSRREIVEIGKLYPSAQIFLGPDSTEENAKIFVKNAHVVHLAAHCVTDPINPLDSFIALSATDDPNRENGLLQAWEIYERIRLNAGLVVLSACETAFSPELGGEGLLSLSRAFLVAGARTVVASLWSVGDDSTAELMIRFYAHLREGKTKDEALRAAQLEFIRGPVTLVNSKGERITEDFSNPHFWAMFQVVGDWR